MKKLIFFALLGMLLIGGTVATYAQGQDSTEVATDEPKDTISIDNMDPVYYEDEAPEASNTTTYAIIGGVVVIAAGAFIYLRKKKK